MSNNIVNLPSDLEGARIHFVGIKGTGMVALVEILNARGAVITGSDVSERFYTDEILEKIGIKAMEFSADNVTKDIQFVVYSSAYSPEKNPDLKKAVELGIPMMLYSEALGAISRTAYSAGICGVHGKTTTTGLTGTLLKFLPLNSQILAGSIIASFENSCTLNNDNEGNRYFVAETCEYQRHFMAYSPSKIILTSVESDHQDYYPTFKDIQDAFVDYACLLPEGGQLIYCADDEGAVETADIAKARRPDISLVPYGVKAEGDYKLTFGSVEKGRQIFNIQSLGQCALRVSGEHNARNATAAAALCCELLKTEGKNPLDYSDRIKEGLEAFAGGKRRSEIVGHGKNKTGNEIVFLDDYGHHPTAIKTTLAGYREFYKGHKIIVDFMSHTYTRTAALLEEFASSFGSADIVILNKIYGSAREDASAANVTGEILAETARKYHDNVVYAGEFDEAAEKAMELLQEPLDEKHPDGYLFVTMGAGDNWKVGKKIMENL
ncbi:MAG: UDP-N-acetylmuramate--L-alanine ligase [Treponema sp.]|nr:UDP-N-acetylmuramate--L-alanine ligase [Candidatus Treponema equi]